MLASGTIVSNSDLASLSEDSEETGMTTAERCHFYVINENSFGKMDVFSTISKTIIKQDCEALIKNFMSEAFWEYVLANLTVIVYCLVTLILAWRMSNKNEYNIAIFMTFSEHEIKKLLQNAECFLENELLSPNYLREYWSPKIKLQNIDNKNNKESTKERELEKNNLNENKKILIDSKKSQKHKKSKRSILNKKLNKLKHKKTVNNLSSENAHPELRNERIEVSPPQKNKVKLFIQQKMDSAMVKSAWIMFVSGVPTLIYISFMILKFINMSKEINETIEEGIKITQAGTRSRLTFSIAQEIIASRSESQFIQPNGESLFDQYKSNASQYLNSIINQEKSESISHYHEKLEAIIHQILFENYCLYYLQSIEEFECNEELLNVGLETVTIYILEKSAELLNTFRSSEMNKQDAISLINGEKFNQLGIYSNFSNKAYMYLQSLSSSFTEASLAQTKWWTYFDFIILTFVCLLAYNSITGLILNTLRIRIQRNQELEQLLPTSLIQNNYAAMLFIFGDKALADKKNRRHKKRVMKLRGF